MFDLRFNFNAFLAFLLLCRFACSQDDSGAAAQSPVEEIPEKFEEYCGEHASLEFLETIEEPTSFTFNYKYKDKTPEFGSYVVKNNVKVHNDASGNYPLYVDVVPYGVGQVKDKVESSESKNETSVNIKGSRSEVQLVFIDGYSFASRAGELRLTGLNQQWLGCPLSLCIYGMLDAAYTLSSGKTYLVRGRYVWDLSKPPLYSNRVLFENENPGVQPHVDWAFGFDDEKYFGRDKQVFCQKESHQPCEGTGGKLKMSSEVPSVFNGQQFAPNHIVQAGFSIPKRNEAKAHAFLVYFEKRDEKSHGYIRKFELVNRTKEDKRFNDSFVQSAEQRDRHAQIHHGYLKLGLDAAFRKDDDVYFLTRNSYLKVNIDKIIKGDDEYNVGSWFDGVDPALSNEEELFNCPEDIYTGHEWIKDRNAYRSSFPRLYDSPQSEKETRNTLKLIKHGRPTPAPRLTEWGNSYLPIVLAVILTGVVVIVVAIIVTERRRRLKKKLRIIKLRKHGLVDNRPGNKDGVGAHRSHLDDDILGDTYTPGKKLKTVIKKTPGLGQSSQLSSTGSSIGSSIGSTTGKTPSSIKMVGSRAVDEDLTLKSNMGSKLFTKKGSAVSHKGSQKPK